MIDANFSKFPHIEQFRTVVKHVTDTARWVGRDVNGDPIFDRNVPLPTLKFTGTVKIHGTNSAVGVLTDGTQWVQSREHTITPEKDNAGFATFAYKNKDRFAEMHTAICYDVEKYKGIVIFGEWGGGNIQKGVAISKLPKMFVVFAIELLAKEEGGRNIYLDKYAIQEAVGHDEENRIFNIFTFGEWEIDIHFEEPRLATPQLVELTEMIEACCPVGKFFGIDGIGEGLVWACNIPPYSGSAFMFKVKGSLHQTSKVKVLAAVDIEKVNSVKECVDKIVTESRLNQGLDHLRMNQLDIIPQNLGTFIKWVYSDAIREELDTIIESGLEPKEVGKEISNIARKWFFATTQQF